MGTKVKKGILKPIRYISQIFDNKEPEMQIGFPTDIKHVAHIGCDGPNTNAPTWMKDYHSAPINPTYDTNEKERSAPNWGSQGADFLTGGIEESSTMVVEESAPPTRPRHTRRHKSDETSKKSTDVAVIGAGESVEESKKNRRARKKADSAGGSQDMPTIPKQSHRRRSKDSSGGSAKPSKTKGSKHDESSKSGCTDEG